MRRGERNLVALVERLARKDGCRVAVGAQPQMNQIQNRRAAGCAQERGFVVSRGRGGVYGRHGHPLKPLRMPLDLLAQR